MTWKLHSNGQRAFHGTTETGGKFAIAEGISAEELLAFANHLEKSLELKASNLQPASGALFESDTQSLNLPRVDDQKQLSDAVKPSGAKETSRF